MVNVFNLVLFLDTDSDSIVSVVGYCIRGAGSKTHYEYELRICTVDDRWTILRRYSRFRDLHLAMKVRYRDKVCSVGIRCFYVDM